MGPPPPAMVASEADGCISFSFGAGGGASADLEELPPEFERVDEEEAARVTIVVGTDHLGRDFGTGSAPGSGSRRAGRRHVRGQPPQLRGGARGRRRGRGRVFGWPSAATVAAGRRLRWIACPGAGVDKIVKAETTRRRAGVTLTNAPGTHVVAMAEHVLGSMVSLAHRFHDMEAARQRGEWDTQRWNGKILELSAKTVFVFGYGDVGKAVAKRAEAFDMTVTHSTRSSTAEEIDALCGRANFLVIAAPINEATKNAFDRRRLALLPKDAVVVVISRGGIVDEDALCDLLESGALAGAALDSTAVEPLPKASRLWSLRNVILTPHASALSAAAPPRVFEANLDRFLRGDALENAVDMATAY
ncbi:phosphoglycerate dehydrogenase [Aureococcus anophagefferens]|nr:phosphoglycerate dehydrogenase [Aureococcus anophagefferens]